MKFLIDIIKDHEEHISSYFRVENDGLRSLQRGAETFV